MRPCSVPQFMKDQLPNHDLISIGPPEGIADEDCGTVEALCGSITVDQGSAAFDGAPSMRTYWSFSDEDLEELKGGGKLELVFYTTSMPVHSVTIR